MGVRCNFGIHIFGVFNHAHDFVVAAVADSIEPQMFSDGIFVWKVFMCQCIIHHSHVPGGRRIALFDGPASQEMSANGFKIVCAHKVVDRIIIVSVQLWLASLNPDLSIPIPAIHGAVEGDARA